MSRTGSRTAGRAVDARLLSRVVASLLGLAVLGGVAGCGITGGPELKTLTAYFDKTVGVYVKNDVRVLGVRIGEVTAIEPMGTRVRIDMTYDAQYTLPADAQAVVVAPSIVSDRYVQITPVYETGPVLESGAEIPLERTAVPVELDDIYAALDELNVALGPEGANRDGALSDLLDVGAQNLAGNGELLGSTLDDLSRAVGTLSDQRGDLFDTIRNLQDFTSTLAASDATVRQFNRDLADVAAQLEAEKEDLATAVRSLGVALGEVAAFVRQNEDELTANVEDLASITRVLVTQKTALEEFLDTAPTALSNLQLAYNPRSGTLDTRDNNEGTATPEGLLCNLLIAAGQSPDACDELATLLDPNGLPSPPGAAAAPAAGSTAPSAGRDLTLGGILEVQR